MIETLKQHVLSGGMINEEQAKELAAVPDKEALYEAAHQITRHFMGNKFDTCSIINAKAGIAAKTVNGVHSPDIIKQT